MTEIDGLEGLRDLISVLPTSSAAKEQLLQRMAEPHRHYHGLGHLDVLWRRHTLLWRDSGIEEDMHLLIACAIAFHDVVFDLDAKDNEVRSAEFWLSVSGAGELSAEARSWVADTIAATAHHEVPLPDVPDSAARARQWVLDLDLSTLGESPGVFDRNVDLLRAEAPRLSDKEWEISLARTLQRFAAMQPIYKSEPISLTFTEPARRNIERHLGRLQAAT